MMVLTPQLKNAAMKVSQWLGGYAMNNKLIEVMDQDVNTIMSKFIAETGIKDEMATTLLSVVKDIYSHSGLAFQDVHDKNIGTNPSGDIQIFDTGRNIRNPGRQYPVDPRKVGGSINNTQAIQPPKSTTPRGNRSIYDDDVPQQQTQQSPTAPVRRRRAV